MMRIYADKSLRCFKFWSGAADTVQYLTDDEMDTIESMLEDLYPDGMDETDLNDFLWFDTNTIAEWLGYDDFDAIITRDDEDEVEEA